MRKRVSRWSTAQRVVVVVGWAGLLQAIWIWLRSDGLAYTFGDDSGWFNYAPNSGVVFSGGGPSLWMTNPTLTMVTQIGFVVLWLVSSFWLLGIRPVDGTADRRSQDPEVGSD